AGAHSFPPALPPRRSSDLFLDDTGEGLEGLGARELPAVEEEPGGAGQAEGLALGGVAVDGRGSLAAREARAERRHVQAHLGGDRSEEHTSELQSRENIVCR